MDRARIADVPSRIGGYRVLECLGEGAHSVVFRGCSEGEPAREVAIKLVPLAADSPIEARVRFEHEARILSSLAHPNIVRLLDYGATADTQYLITELAPGESLGSMLARRELPSAMQAVAILQQVAAALAHAHGKRVLHGDIKPSNVMVSLAALGVRLVDFGLSRFLDHRRNAFEADAQSAGTLLYMSPEQLRIGAQGIDERSELYSLGMVAVEMLTGAHPYAGLDLRELVRSHASIVPNLPKSVPPMLARVVQSLVAKDPADRYRTARGLASDLARLQEALREGGDAAFELRLDDEPQTFATPRFLGRDAEREALNRAYERAREALQVMAVVGLSGAGKTRLIAQVCAGCACSVVLWGSGRAFGQTAAYGVVADALRGLPRAGLAPEAQRGLRAAVGELGADVLELVPELATLLGEFPAPVALGPDRKRLRFFGAIRALLAALGNRRDPLVLVLDDLQWADEGSLELVLYLARDSGLHVLLILAYREDELGPDSMAGRAMGRLADEHGMVSVTLAPLPETEVAMLVASMLGGERLAIARAVAAQSEGSPLYAVELVASLSEQGLLHSDAHAAGDMTRVARALAQVSISGTLASTIVGRLDRLEPAAQEVLRAAAVIGPQFEIELVRRVVEAGCAVDAEQAARQTIAALAQAEQLRLAINLGKAGLLGFAHDKIRESLYDRLDAGERARLHGCVGRAIEACGGDDEGRTYLLAHHYKLGADAARAVRWARAAGDLALRQTAFNEALTFYDNARVRLAELDATERGAIEPALIESIADVCSILAYGERAVDGYQLLLARGRWKPGVDLGAARLYNKIGRAYYASGEYGAAAGALEESLRRLGLPVPRSAPALAWMIGRELVVQACHSILPPRAPPRRDSALLEVGNGLSLAAYVLYRLDCWRAVAYHLYHLNLAERCNLVDDLGAVWSEHGPAACLFGLNRRAIRYARRSLEHRQQQGDRWGVAKSRGFLVHTLAQSGRWREADEHARLAIADMEAIGDRWELVQVLHFRIDNLVHLGHWDEVLRSLQLAQRVYGESGNAMMRRFITYQFLGELPRGDQQAVLEGIDRTFVENAACTDPMQFVRLLNSRAKVLMRLGRPAQAEQAYAESKRRMRNPHLRTLYLVDAYFGHAEAIVSQAEAAQGAERVALLARAARSLREARLNLLGFPPFAAALLRVRARHAWLCGRRRRAERLWLRCRHVATELSQRYQFAQCLAEQGLALREADPVRSANLLAGAWAEFAAQGAQTDLQRLTPHMPAGSVAPPASAAVPQSAALQATAQSAQARTPSVTAERLESLCALVQRMASVASLDELLQAIVDAAARLLLAERAELHLWHEARQGLERRATSSTLVEPARPVSSTILGNALREGRGILIANAQREPALADADSVTRSGTHSVLCVPLKFQGRLLGALYLDNRLLAGLFDADDLELLSTFASQAAVALEAKATELRLLAAQARLEQVVDAASETYWDCDLASGEVQITQRRSPGIAAADGEAADNPGGFAGLFEPEDQLRLRAALQRCVQGHADTIDEEARLHPRHGEDRWCQVRGRVIARDAAGTGPQRMLGTLQDITPRRRAEAQRAATLSRLEAVVELDRVILQGGPAAQVAGLALRHLGLLVGCDIALALQFEADAATARVIACLGMPAALGYRDGAAMALSDLPAADLDAIRSAKVRSVDALEAPEGTPRLPASLQRAGVRSYQLVPLRANRRVIGALLSASVTGRRFDNQTAVVGWSIANVLAIALEQQSLRQRVEQQTALLEQRVAERTEQLEVANRELEGFSYTVSHDLRAPLRNLDELSRLALEDLNAPRGGMPRYLEAIRSSVRKMNRLVEDLLTFSRTGHGPVGRHSVDLNVVVAEARELCEPDLLNHGRRVEWQVAPLPTVAGDPALLRVVLYNLLANALKFTRDRDPARIRIETEPGAPDRVRLRVADNGIGFDPKRADKLFGVFQRLHSEREFAGTGIGLATVRRIVERHGGSVRADSLPGRGATFVVELPLPEDAAPDMPEPGTASLQNR